MADERIATPVEAALTMLYVARWATPEIALQAAELITSRHEWAEYGSYRIAILQMPDTDYWVLADLEEVPYAEGMAWKIVEPEVVIERTPGPMAATPLDAKSAPVGLAPVCPGCEVEAEWFGSHWGTTHEPGCTWMADLNRQTY